ncbi:hypothetical protein GYMLUDRAFT_65319 [Collybiopsis luxurians FD-317 M1]|uniref:F-box domain-containing protein n=1 Tax=Collybiopsis luxurians FD-317 M1 TaxID=944289 RepID=A0A0D0BLT3_9AGAR|nr:hypothetical protein GYMLUDRAFT_65319 [Collybiopsis luxurians FD-317 M1]
MASFDDGGGGRYPPAAPSKLYTDFQPDLPMQAESTQPAASQSQTLYMPIDSPPTPAPSPGPTNIMSIIHHRDQPSISPSSAPSASSLPILSPLALPQNPVLRRQYLAALLHACTPTELLFISTTIAPLLKRDFLRALPPELALHILGFVDEPKTLARAAQVSRWWRRLVSDEALWKRMCRAYGFDDDGRDEFFTRRKGKRKGNGEQKSPVLQEVDQALTSLSNLSIDLPSAGFSYREHFKYSYSIMKNWHNGGHLLRAHKVSATTITTSDSGVITSLALDEDWVVVGLANCRIHVFSARTGVLARTLVGHDLGVWAVCLVHKGGYMGGEVELDSKSARRGRRKRKDSVGKRGHLESPWKRPEARARYSEGDIETLSSTNTSPTSPGYPAAYVASNHTASTNLNNNKDLYQFVPPSLRIALGLHPENDDDSDSENDGKFSDGDVDNDEEEEHQSDILDEDAESNDEKSSSPRRSSAHRCPGKPSSMSGSSEGWGQPGAIVVSGGCDKVLRVWDIRSGYCIYVLRGHTSTIRCIKVLHNRPIAVTGSRDNTLRVWDVQRGRLLRTLAGHTGSVRCLDVCGNRVVSGSYDHTCRLWDVDTGECLHVLRGHLHQIYSVAFDGYRIASGGLDTTVRVWDAETGQCKATLQGHTALVCQLQLSPTMLATGGSDGRVIMFSLPHPDASSSRTTLSSSATLNRRRRRHAIPNDFTNCKVLHRIAAHDSSVTALQFDDRFLVTGGNDGRVRLYETQTGNYVRDLSEPSDCVWKVGYGTGGAGFGSYGGRRCGEVLAIMCRRQGKTVMEIWSLKPREGEEAGRDGEESGSREEEREGEGESGILDC